MGEDFEYEEDEPQEEKMATLPRSVVKDLEKKAKQAETEAQQRLAAERKLAFYEAGVPKTKQSEYFMKGYDGELSAEAIRQAAIEAGFLEDDRQDEVPPDEVAAHQRMANASSGAGTDPVYDHEAAIAAADSVEEIMRLSQKAGFPTTWDG